jgi:nicotinamidase-related amidase
VKRALLIVDCLNDFLDPQGALTCGAAGRDALQPIARELQTARSAGDLVIFACDRHLPDDSEFELYPAHCVEGTWGAHIVPELAPCADERILPKRRFSAFYGTDLELTLREQGIDELRIVGVCTNICVLYTAADARMRGFAVSVPEAAVASFDPEAHRFALLQLTDVLHARVESQ